VRISPTLSDGKLLYTQALPPGMIGPGAYGVVALGGQDVGSFSTSVASRGHPIDHRLTSRIGHTRRLDFVVTWTGGNPRTW